jgi:hypothetical protein
LRILDAWSRWIALTEKIEKPVDGQTASYKWWKIDL